MTHSKADKAIDIVFYTQCALSETGLKAAIEIYKDYGGPKGGPLTLTVAPANEFKAKELVKETSICIIIDQAIRGEDWYVLGGYVRVWGRCNGWYRAEEFVK